MEELIKLIEKEKIVAIVRGIDPEKMEPLFNALLEGGIRQVEITLNTKNVFKSISNMNKIFGTQMTIGAGTVLNEEMASKAIESGARFLVSPNVDKGMITTAIENNVLPLPGAMTPTEIARALNYGAKIIKLFPSTCLGPDFIKELMGPLESAKLIAVGGVSLDNAREYIKSGAIGIGVGGSLINKAAIESSNFKAITEYAIKLKKAVEI